MSKWEKVKLGDIGNFKSGGTPSRSKSEYFTGDIPWITTVSLGKLQINQNDAVEFITSEAVAGSATKIIKNNSIMIGIRVGVGKVSINTVPMCTSQDIISIEDIDENKFYKPYLVRCINSYNQFFNTQKRGATIQGINSGVLKELEIPLPPLETQKQIAKTLDIAAELLAMRKQQLAELDNLIKSTFYEMFGDPVENKKGWEVVKYYEIMTEKSKNGFFAKNDFYSSDGNCEVIWISDFIDKMYCDISNLKKVSATEKDILNYEVSYGDLLFCRSSLTKAGIGKCSYVPLNIRKNTLFECHIIRTRVDLNKVHPIFLQIQTTTDYFRNQIISKSKTSTMTTIGQEGIVNNSILLPPIDIQNQFAQQINRIEQQKALVQESISETQYLFDSLMSQYFD